MGLNEIEDLLEKYNAALTSLEEAQLKAFFEQANIPEHLKVYKTLFDCISITAKQSLKNKIPLKTNNKSLKKLSIAVVILLLFGLFLQNNSKQNTAAISNEYLNTYAKKKQALEMLSTQLNRGTHKLNSLNTLSQSLQRGKQNINFLNTFNTTTQYFLKLILIFKTMKNLLSLLFLCIYPTIFAQSLFDKYEDMDNVTSVVVNQKMFKMLAEMNIQTDDQEADAFLNQVKTLENLTVYTTEDPEVSKAISKDVNNYIKNSKLEELIRIKEADRNIKFCVRSGQDDYHVSELLMLVNGEDKLPGEMVLLSLIGDIDLRMVSELTKKLNLPGGDLLKKVTKKQ